MIINSKAEVIFSKDLALLKRYLKDDFIKFDMIYLGGMTSKKTYRRLGK